MSGATLFAAPESQLLAFAVVGWFWLLVVQPGTAVAIGAIVLAGIFAFVCLVFGGIKIFEGFQWIFGILGGTGRFANLLSFSLALLVLFGIVRFAIRWWDDRDVDDKDAG